ncbi:MAG: rhomboid family intramembrane serine protease [Salibacteraceae bacterium]
MFPIQDTIPSRSFPLVTWSLIAINALVFLIELNLNESQLQSFFYLFGLVPARYTHPEWAQVAGLYTDNLWPFLTNIFLHGGWGHFLGNMWTLYIFGDNVEERMGSRSFLLFYLICGVVASFAHFYFNADSTLPALGASGAISGVMGAYMFMFPHSRIVFFIPLLFIPYFIELSAFIYLAVWFIGQLYAGTFTTMLGAGAGGIAFWAHIGGFVAGALLYKFFTKAERSKFYDDQYFRRYTN